MTPAARERLRSGGIDRLVDLLLDDVLSRPVEELVDPAWLGRQLAAAAGNAAADPRVEGWFRERVRDARARVPAGAVAVPIEVKRPLRELAARPYVPDRALVGQLLDHDTARLLLKNLFLDLLIAFGKKLRPALPSGGLGSGPRGALAGLKGLQKLGENVLGGIGEGLEREVEHRAREFMDAGVQRLVDKLADQICDPTLVREYGAWRLHAVDVLLRTDARRLAAEVEKLDPDSLVDTGAALVRGIAGRPELAGELETVIRSAMEAMRGQSVRDLLGGVEEHGLGVLREILVQRARAVVETEAFEVWWDEVVGG